MYRARLSATVRIVDAAQHLGMQPASHWAYVNGKRVTVIPAAKGSTASTQPASDPVQRFIAALGSVFGLRGS